MAKRDLNNILTNGFSPSPDQEGNELFSINYSNSDLDRWIKLGVMPKKLGKFAVKELAKFKEFHEMQKRGATEEEWLDWRNKECTYTEEALKTGLEFVYFLMVNKSNLLSMLSLMDEKTFRQSRELIDNKLNVEVAEPSQLSLFDDHEPQEKVVRKGSIPAQLITRGIDLSPAEDKLVYTLSLLLSRKSERYDQSSPKYYMGNYETGMVTIDSVSMETARIVVSPHELYSTYLGRSNYNTDHIKFILGVLNDLAKENHLVTINVLEKSVNGRNKSLRKARTHLPLFQVVILNSDLTESESQEIDNSELLVEGKKCHLLFKFGPVFTQNIRDRYVEFPEDIHIRIAKTKAAGEKGRIPQCVNLMRDFLFREKQQKRYEVERDEETMIRMLGLSKLWATGKKSLARERISKAFEIFKELGLLRGVDQTVGSKGQNKFILKINQDFK